MLCDDYELAALLEADEAIRKEKAEKKAAHQKYLEERRKEDDARRMWAMFTGVRWGDLDDPAQTRAIETELESMQDGADDYVSEEVRRIEEELEDDFRFKYVSVDYDLSSGWIKIKGEMRPLTEKEIADFYKHAESRHRSEAEFKEIVEFQSEYYNAIEAEFAVYNKHNSDGEDKFDCTNDKLNISGHDVMNFISRTLTYIACHYYDQLRNAYESYVSWDSAHETCSTGDRYYNNEGVVIYNGE